MYIFMDRKKLLYATAAALLCALIVLSAALLPGGKASAALQDEYNYAKVYFNGRETDITACTLKGSVYLKVADFNRLAGSGAYTISEKDMKVYLEPAEMDLYIVDDVTTRFIKNNAGRCYFVLKSIPFNGSTSYEPCVSLNVMSQFCGLSFTTDGSDGLSNSEKTDITEVYISSGSSDSLARINEDTWAAGSVVDGEGNNFILEKGELVTLLSESRSFYRVETMSGEVCYVSKDSVALNAEDDREYDFVYSAKSKRAFRDKFNLVWQTVSGTGVSDLPPDETGGIDVVAPMWYYQQVESGGNITNYGDKGFVELAHARGFKVWSTFKNNVSDNSRWQSYTTSVLESEELRNKTIAQYLFYAAIYGVDGVNIDFEYLTNANRDYLTAFMETLGYYADRMGLQLSIDTLINESYNKMYDYEALADIVDYLMVMTYDYHYNGSLYAGSVSPQSWYTAEVEELLELVPSDKLVMGIPFYCRIYSVDDKGYNLALSSSEIVLTYGMQKMRETVIKINNTSGEVPEWSHSDGQFYLEYMTATGVRKCVWLENERSIANRLSYVYHYDLAGSCCWKYGLEEEGVYDVFEAIYKDGVSPGAYSGEYLRD